MKNSKFRVWFGLCIGALIMLNFIHGSKAQSSSSEHVTLLQLQQQLEYPEPLKSWNKWTDFCYLPSTYSVNVICSNGHVTELSIVGNKTWSGYLSHNLSIDGLFMILTKLRNLKKLSLISLGIWGNLPSKIDRFRSLEMLNISSNFIYGEIPNQISSLKSLKSLVLSNNLIHGNFPNLISLQNLQELDLSNNKIGPNFPTLGTNLITIILRNNSIRSSIPTQIKNLNKLQKIDISSNNLVGPIPQFVFSIPSIWYINLAKNQLTGELAQGTVCGNRLWFVDISKNLLLGKLPTCIGSDFSKYRRVFSDWNCLSGLDFQNPEKFCARQAIAVIPPKKSGLTQKEEERVSGIKLGIVFGVIGGIILVFGTVCSLFWVICKRRDYVETLNCSKYDKSVVGGKLADHHPLPVVESSKYAARSMRMPTTGFPPYQQFTLAELQDAINKFDRINLVTEWSHGQERRGFLPSGSAVVIKCIKVKDKISSKTINQHMEVISQLRHQNLVSVLGHCVVTGQERNKGCTIFIVLENVANGSLREHLTDWRRKDKLKWPQRMTISMGIARGVHFLHNGIVPGVFGNDLKMENVLLDDSLTPKVHDYKISSPLQAENPNLQNDSTSENSEKEDIYKLGVIMLELLTGKQVTSENQVDELKLQLETSLESASASSLQQVIDRTMKGTFAYQSVKTASQITVNCLCKDASRRPPMEDVVWHLQYSIQTQQAWTTSGNLALNSGNLGLLK